MNALLFTNAYFPVRSKNTAVQSVVPRTCNRLSVWVAFTVLLQTFIPLLPLTTPLPIKKGAEAPRGLWHCRGRCSALLTDYATVLGAHWFCGRIQRKKRSRCRNSAELGEALEETGARLILYVTEHVENKP